MCQAPLWPVRSQFPRSASPHLPVRFARTLADRDAEGRPNPLRGTRLQQPLDPAGWGLSNAPPL